MSKSVLVLLVLFISLANLSFVNSAFIKMCSFNGDSIGDNILWFTLKNGFDRTGYYNVSRILNGISYTVSDYEVVWRVKAELCIATSPVIGDLDNDGTYEVIYASCDGYIYVINSITGEIEWRYITGGEFADPLIWDIDGDGYPEIITMGAQGILYVLNYTGQAEWFYKNRFFRGSPVVLDIDNDGYYEVVAGSSDGFLYVFSHNGELINRIKLGDYPVQTPSLADIDKDGIMEVFVVEGYYLHIVDLSENGEYSVYTLDLGHDLIGPPVLYDVDNDDSKEVIISSRDGWLFIVDPIKGTIIGEVETGAEDVTSSPSVGDVDGDGSPDIVLGTLQGLYVYSLSLSLEAYYDDIQDYTSHPIIADVDDDGVNEILLGEENGYFVILDVTYGSGSFEEIDWWYETGGPIMGSVAIADVDNDHLPEIFIGSRDYYMYCFKPVATIENKTIITTNSHSSATSSITTKSSPTTIQETTTMTTEAKTKTTRTTSTITWSINLPKTIGREKAVLRTDLILYGLIAGIIIVVITYIYTRRKS